jgi:Zn-dependent protease with chaperone function
MTAAVIAAAYAVALAVLGSSVLSRVRWFEAVPRLGIALWLAALWSMVVAGIAALVLGVLATEPLRHLFVELVSACLHSFHEHELTKSAAALVAVTAALTLFGWWSARTVQFTVSTRLSRHRHRHTLRLVGVRDPKLEAIVVDHPTVKAYCLPGAGGGVVLTSATVRVLTCEQLAAVIEHERAHLRGHHHMLTGTLHVVAASLPRVPLAQSARVAVHYLIERLADEHARRACGADAISAALLVVGTSRGPALALGMGGADAVRRARLLTRSMRRPALLARVGVAVAAAVLFAAPLVWGTAHAAALAANDPCAAVGDVA